MSEPAAVITEAPPAPDTAAQDIPCPLCGYNLRGLIEPRCPECGYAFDWPDVLDPARRPHPYLFEHHPERNVRSFVRTYVAGLAPRWFWRTLKPVHPIHRRRLAIYYLITAVFPLLVPGFLIGRLYVTVVREELESRAWQRQMFLTVGKPNSSPAFPNAAAVDAYLATWPSPYWGWWTRKAVYDRMPFDGASVNAAIVTVLWPWLTLAVLMIFRASMRRAKVKPGHVLRCTIYACDWTVWLGGAALVVFTTSFAEQWLPIFYPRAAVPILASALFAAYTTYRLGSAYSLYLAFDRPYATAVASQLIALLLVTAVFVIALGS